MSDPNSRMLSVRRVLRAIATPVCECGKCGHLEQGNPISTMKIAGLVLEIDGETTRIELTPYTLKELREKIKSIDEIDKLTWGQGPFFTKEGKLPNLTHVVAINTTDALTIMAEAAGADVTVVERGLKTAAAA